MNKTGYPSIDKTHLVGITDDKLHPNIMPLSIYSTFCKINEGRMSDIAIKDANHLKDKWSVKTDTEDLAKSFLALKLKRGDSVVFATKNCYESIIAMIAANAIGVRIVVLNNLEKVIELTKQANMFEPKILFISEFSNSAKAYFLANIPSLIKLVYIGGGEQATGIIGDELMSYEDLMELGKDSGVIELYNAIQANMLNEDVCLYLQTSGSKSGKPKILPFTNRAIFASLIYASNSTGTKTNDGSVNKVLCVLPLRLPYGWMTIFVNLMGGNMVVLSGVEPLDISRYYLEEPSYIYGTPIIFRQFMTLTPEDADLSFITAFFCSGFSMGEERYEEGIDYLRKHKSNGEIRNNYGIGEGLCIGTASDGIPHRAGTSGKFYVGPEWLLVDENLNEVKYGEVGEAIVYSQSLCKGYYANPTDTQKAFISRDDGRIFYRTGDMMILSEDGYVTYVGRKERFYQPIGAPDKVNCKTIEDALVTIEDITNAAVVIKHDESGLEYGHAFVESQSDLDPWTIKTELAKTLLEYQIPSKISVIKALPLMKSGKVDYATLANM